MPILNRTKPVKSIELMLDELHSPKTGFRKLFAAINHKFTHQIPVSIIAQQSFARTRRHLDDKGALIILDDRVDEFMHSYLCLSRYSQLDMLLDKLGEFFGGNVC